MDISINKLVQQTICWLQNDPNTTHKTEIISLLETNITQEYSKIYSFSVKWRFKTEYSNRSEIPENRLFK